MTPKEFVDYVFVQRKPNVESYVVEHTSEDIYNKLEALVKIEQPTESDVEELQKFITTIPAEISFHYLRESYLNEFYRPMIEAQKDLLEEIKALRFPEKG